MFKQAHFQIDGGIKYQGIHQGTFWNGWAMPHFPLDVGLKMAEDMNAVTTEEKLVYHPETDSFILEVSYIDKEEWESFKGELIDGEMFYPIGNGSWIWDVAED